MTSRMQSLTLESVLARISPASTDQPSLPRAGKPFVARG